jgi:hypothetical protein
MPDTKRDLEQRVRDVERRLDEVAGFVLAVAFGPPIAPLPPCAVAPESFWIYSTRMWALGWSSPTRWCGNAGTETADHRFIVATRPASL